MKPDCVLAIGQVLGRQPSTADIRNVEDRIADAMRTQAANDPAGWAKLPPDAQVREGAQRAAQALAAEAALKQERRILQVNAAARMQGELAAFPGRPLEALAHLVAFHANHKGSIMSLETRAKAIASQGLGRMMDTIEATAPGFFGLIENQAGMQAVVRELHGQATGNPVAAKGAKAFREIAEEYRQRFNRAGGDVGRLEDWGIPHHHSQIRVAKAGRDKWLADTLPRLDRSRYVTESGRPMTEGELTRFLGEAWTTLATGGANKLEPGVRQGNGMRANRNNESRSIHFKDADAFLEYQELYSERTAYEVMVDHIRAVATDIAAVEAFGPNPDAQYQLFRDRALKAEVDGDPVNANKAEQFAEHVDNLYNFTTGKILPVANPGVAQFFDAVRNLQIASKLGSSFITAWSDKGTMRVAAHVNNLPQMQLIRNELASLNPANQVEKRLAMRAGLALNTMTHTLNRFGNETPLSGVTGKLAAGVLRGSGMLAWTEAGRRAYGVTMMSALGAVVRDTPRVDGLDAHDWRILRSKGITPVEWQVWRQAKLEDWGNGNDTMLTPEAIYRIPDAALGPNARQLKESAATRLLGAVLEETDMAVIEPGVRERVLMQGHTRRGSIKGELTRSVLLFKSFPVSMITKHWQRAMAEESFAGKAGYLSALLATTTVLGMIAFQASQVAQGKDPRDMTEWETWVQAVLKGGALSIFGDFMLQDQTEYGRSFMATALGPVAGTAEEAIALTLGNVHQLSRGEDTNFGAEAMRLGKTNTPGANLWYSRAAVDHLVLHQLQEYLSPGYLRKMRRRAKKEYGQSFWWEPGATLPERAPDLEAALGD